MSAVWLVEFDAMPRVENKVPLSVRVQLLPSVSRMTNRRLPDSVSMTAEMFCGDSVAVPLMIAAIFSKVLPATYAAFTPVGVLSRKFRERAKLKCYGAGVLRHSCEICILDGIT